jgi:hypothetical protein
MNVILMKNSPMKIFAGCLVCFFAFLTNAQLNISETDPQVITSFRQQVYVGVENPVRITPGKFQNVKVTATNATIKYAKEKGLIYVNPEWDKDSVFITVSNGNWKKNFAIRISRLSLDPELELVGQFNEDRMIINFKTTTGIWVFHRGADIDLKYKVDSVRVEIEDSTGNKQNHMNIGAAWDDETRKMLKEAQAPLRMLIYDAYLTMPTGRRIRAGSYIRYYFSKW